MAKLKEWQATIKASQRLGKNPLDSFELNFLFVGSPGELVLEVVPWGQLLCDLCSQAACGCLQLSHNWPLTCHMLHAKLCDNIPKACRQ